MDCLKALNTIGDKVSNSEKLASSGLLTGELGRLLFLIEFSEIQNLDKKNFSNQLIEVIDTMLHEKECNFLNGFSGLGWGLVHLSNRGYIDKEELVSLLDKIDDLCYEYSMGQFKNNNHDFFYGGLGSAVYLVSRVDNNQSVTNYVTDILHSLESISKYDKNGRYWEESSTQKDGNILFGMAHGLAGKISFLASVAEKDIEQTKCLELIEDTLLFLREYKLKDQYGLYPYSDFSVDSKLPSRLAWCHGDLGIAVAILKVANQFKIESLKDEAIEIGLHSCQRKTVDQTGIKDLGFCHGSSGVAYLDKRLYDQTGQKDFFEAHKFWLCNVIKEIELGNYEMWDEVNSQFMTDYSLLTGLSGVGLVLMDFVRNQNSDWDKSLLL